MFAPSQMDFEKTTQNMKKNGDLKRRCERRSSNLYPSAYITCSRRKVANKENHAGLSSNIQSELRHDLCCV